MPDLHDCHQPGLVGNAVDDPIDILLAEANVLRRGAGTTAGLTRAVAILQAVLLMTATVALLQQRSQAVEAAASLAGPPTTAQTSKGFVIMKAEGSLTIREAGSTVQVAVNKDTQVLGRRSSFNDIAINDLVRVEATITADGNLVAARIEVLLAADGLSAGQRTKGGPQH